MIHKATVWTCSKVITPLTANIKLRVGLVESFPAVVVSWVVVSLVAMTVLVGSVAIGGRQ